MISSSSSKTVQAIEQWIKKVADTNNVQWELLDEKLLICQCDSYAVARKLDDQLESSESSIRVVLRVEDGDFDCGFIPEMFLIDVDRN